MRKAVVLLVFSVAVAWGGPRDRSDGTYTIVGRMDSARYQALGAFKPLEDIQKADRSFAQREYETALAQYEQYVGTHGQSPEAAPRAVVSYATLMQGVCLLRVKQYEPACARLAQVVKAWPGTDDAHAAQFQLVQAWREQRREDRMVEALDAYLEKADKLADKSSRAQAYQWAADYYSPRRRESPQSQAKWVKATTEVVRADPSRNMRKLEDLLEYHTEKGDWTALRSVAVLRMPASQAELHVLDTGMRLLSLDYEWARMNPPGPKDLASRIEAFADEAAARAAAFKTSDPNKYADFMCRLIGFCLKCQLPRGHDMLRAWMNDNPRDRVALLAYAGYVKHGPWDQAAVEKVFVDYLKANSADGGVRDAYVGLLRARSADPKTVVAVIRQYGGGDWELAEFHSGTDEQMALTHYVAAANDDKQSSSRRSAASLAAAEIYRKRKQWADAIAYYTGSQSSVPEVLNALGDCHHADGQWKKAVGVWRRAAENRRNRVVWQDASFKMVKALLENKDPAAANEARLLFRAAGRGPFAEAVKALCDQHGVSVDPPK